MKSIIAIVALVATSIASFASVTVDQLVDQLPESYKVGYRRTAVIVEARKNAEFYESLAAKGFKFDDVELAPSHFVQLHFQHGKLDRITDFDAAKFLSVPQYQSFVAAKVKGFQSALEAYDWIQRQRLTVMQASPSNATEKGELLAVIGDQVSAQEKAKPKE